MLAYRKNFYIERSDKSAIYNVKRFETFQKHFGEYFFLTEHLVYTRPCPAV